MPMNFSAGQNQQQNLNTIGQAVRADSVNDFTPSQNYMTGGLPR